MTNYNERLDEILAKHGAEPGEMTHSLKQAIISLIKELIGDDEKVPESIFDYGDDDQRKYWFNKLRAELREKVERDDTK